jgi:tetratricopeptide (TPR) repeat protein
MFRIPRYFITLLILLPLLLIQNPSQAQDTGSKLKGGTRAIINDFDGKSIVVFSRPDGKSAIGKVPSGLAVTVTRDPDIVDGATWYRIRLIDFEGYILATLKLGNKTYETLVPFSREALNTQVTNLTESLKAKPDKNAFFKRGLAYLNLKEYSNAETDFEAVTKTDKTNVTAYYLAALAANQREAWGAANQYLDKVYDLLDDIDVIIHNFHAMNYIDWSVIGGNPYLDVTIADSNDIIKVNPQFATAYFYRGIAYGRKGDLANAIKDFNQAVKIDPNYAKIYKNLGLDAFNQQNMTAALDAYSKAILAEPTYAPGYVGRGAVFGVQGNSAKAHAEYQQAIKLDPGYGYAYLGEGNVYALEGKYADAISSYQQAIDSDADNTCAACANAGIGAIYFLQKDYDKALEYYNKAIKLEPRAYDLYQGRAEIYRAMGNTKAAQADLDRAVQLQQGSR